MLHHNKHYSLFIQVEEVVALPGGVALSYLAYEKSDPFDMDSYKLTIRGVANIVIRLRPANALLQPPDDAQVHFNVAFSKLKVRKISYACNCAMHNTCHVNLSSVTVCMRA